MSASLISAVLTPLQSVELCSEPKSQWIEAVRSVGTNPVQLFRTGVDALRAIAERLATSKRATEQQLREAGLRPKELALSQSQWIHALEECGRDFVEQCSAIVEGCCAGAPPSLAPRILGCAVKLAEALGRTGPLLAGLDCELAALSDRLMQLEALYSAAKREVEGLTFEGPTLRAQLTEAERQRMEMKGAHRDQQDLLRNEIRGLQRDLKRAEQRRISVEHQLIDLKRELATLRQSRSVQNLNPMNSMLSSPPRMRSSIELSEVNVIASDPSSSPSTPRVCHNDGHSYRSDANEEYSNPAAASNGLTVRKVRPTSGHSTRNTGATATPFDEDTCSSFCDETSEFGGDTRAERVSFQKPARSEPIADTICRKALLDLGNIYVNTLSRSDPLATSVSSAYSHLAALVREAQERYPMVPHAGVFDASPTFEANPAAGLQWVAGIVSSWAANSLSAFDRALAASLGQSASHLNTLAGLCAPPPIPPLSRGVRRSPGGTPR